MCNTRSHVFQKNFAEQEVSGRFTREEKITETLDRDVASANIIEHQNESAIESFE